MITNRYSRAADASAITLSSLCLVHCLALPLMAASLPVAGVFAEVEWVHKILVLAAIPFSSFVFLRKWSEQQSPLLPVLAITGLLQLLIGAFFEPLHDYEKLLTVTGALMLASAHILRWNKHTL